MESKIRVVTDITLEISFTDESTTIRKEFLKPNYRGDGDKVELTKIKENLITTANYISREIGSTDVEFVLDIFNSFLSTQEKEEFLSNLNK